MTKKHKDDDHGHHDNDKVEVTVNGVEKEIEAGSYLVPDLKARWGIPAEHELNLIQGNGEFHALNDNETIEIHDDDKFISQVKQGGAS